MRGRSTIGLGGLTSTPDPPRWRHIRHHEAPMSADSFHRPPGQRPTRNGDERTPEPQNAAHVGYIQINRPTGLAGWYRETRRVKGSLGVC
jgi:hypothetical protein